MIKYDERYEPPAPIARVIVSNPATGQSTTDVPMLIDSGADVTLLPATVANSLGLKVEGEQMLEAFDGGKSGAPIVSTTVVWGKFTFKGQYVVGAYEVGVLGRDVLNNIRLTLNGPELAYIVH